MLVPLFVCLEGTGTRLPFEYLMRALRKHKHRQFYLAVVVAVAVVVVPTAAVALAAVFLTPKIMQH